MSKRERLLGQPLTLREHEAVQLLVLGWSNQEIADFMVLSERTVRTHMSNMLAKLGAHNRTDAARIAREMGLAEGEPPSVRPPPLRYRHRNGGYEPPQEEGYFWTEVEMPVQRGIIELATSPWGEWRMRKMGGEWEAYHPQTLVASGMRFWGPELPPWGEQR